MIHFEGLKFILCPNSKDGNSRTEITINGQRLDIIKKPKTRTYKVKAFEIIHSKKWYRCEVFPEYCPGFPEFAGRDALIAFLNEVKDAPPSVVELEDDLSEEEL